MPCEPRKNWVKKVTLKPMKMMMQAAVPVRSLYILPVILGHQWCRPPIMPISADPIIT